MKLSFSIKGWHNSSFEEFCEMAETMRFGGIELHNIGNRLFTDKNGAFHDYSAASTLRLLYDKKLTIPCIDTICDISNPAEADAAEAETRRCMEIARFLKIPYIRLKTRDENGGDVKTAESFISRVLEDAEEAGITLLLETTGIFRNTSVLRETLESFASDGLAALWNLSEAYAEEKDPEVIIKNLGAYVRHVHFNDALITDDGIEYCLAGEGELPVKDIMNALRSVNYDGFISLVWDPAWCEEIDDMEIVFAQFTHYMKQFSDTSKNEKTFYYNRAHTGRYIWKKDDLIDLTFPQVLDRLVEDFPDQYCFKYTTLDYTRTYSEFRDDVDNFARVLICGINCNENRAALYSRPKRDVPMRYV